MSSLDRNAWFVPSDGFATQIGIDPSYITVNRNGNSLLELNAVYSASPRTYQGGPGQTPTAWNLGGGTVFWNTMQLLYGTFEARIKFGGVGAHWTFWLYDVITRNTTYQQSPTSQPGIDKDEIDIAECLPAIYSDTTTIRFNTFANFLTNNTSTATVTDYSQNFHVYKCVWTPTDVTFYIDGVQKYQATTNIPNHPMYVIMDIEAGDAGGGAVNSANFPQVYQVDYVKAWDANNNLVFYDEFDGTPVLQTLTTSDLHYVQGRSIISAGGASSQALAFSQNTTSKTLLTVLGLAATNPTTLSVTDSLGNKYQQVGSSWLSGGNTLALFVVPQNKILGGANTVTLTSSVSSTLAVTIAEWCGNRLGGNIQASASQVDVSTTNTWAGTSGSIGPITNNFLYESEAVMAWLNTPATVTIADGTIDLTGSDAFIEDRSLGSLAPFTASFTHGSGGGSGISMGVRSMAEPGAGAPMAQIASDNFTRANENPLSDGGNWTAVSGGPSACQVLTNKGRPVSNTGDCYAIRTGSVWPNAQYSEVTMDAVQSGGEYRVIILASSTAFATLNSYWARVLNVASSQTVSVFKQATGSTNTSLGSGTMNLAVGDVVRLERSADGTTLRLKQNGVIKATITDSSYSSGKAGFAIAANGTAANSSTTLWAGGSTAFAISGSAGVAGATVSYSGAASGSVTADGSGNYSIPALGDGAYTITPSKTGYSFSPTNSSQTVAGLDITGVNFTATQIVVATPTFSPVAGSYGAAQSVTVSDTDSGLAGFAMYYTTDGSTPTSGSTLYTGAITVSSSLTLKVLATATGYADSVVGSAAYVITSGAPSQLSITMLDASTVTVAIPPGYTANQFINSLRRAGGVFDAPPDPRTVATWWPYKDWKKVVTS